MKEKYIAHNKAVMTSTQIRSMLLVCFDKNLMIHFIRVLSNILKIIACLAKLIRPELILKKTVACFIFQAFGFPLKPSSIAGRGIYNKFNTQSDKKQI